MQTDSKLWAIVPAAGAGRRMGTDTPKQYLQLGEKTVLEHTLDTLLSCQPLAGVILVLSHGDERWMEIQPRYTSQALQTAGGGTERSHSVLNGLNHLAGCAADDDWVLVHDAARPCVRREDIECLIKTLQGGTRGGLSPPRMAATVTLAFSPIC